MVVMDGDDDGDDDYNDSDDNGDCDDGAASDCDHDDVIDDDGDDDDDVDDDGDDDDDDDDFDDDSDVVFDRAPLQENYDKNGQPLADVNLGNVDWSRELGEFAWKEPVDDIVDGIVHRATKIERAMPYGIKLANGAEKQWHFEARRGSSSSSPSLFPRMPLGINMFVICLQHNGSPLLDHRL